MKKLFLGVMGVLIGVITISGSFVDYGLPNAGPGKPSQTGSSIFGAFMFVIGLGQLASYFLAKSDSQNNNDSENPNGRTKS